MLRELNVPMNIHLGALVPGGGHGGGGSGGGGGGGGGGSGGSGGRGGGGGGGGGDDTNKGFIGVIHKVSYLTKSGFLCQTNQS